MRNKTGHLGSFALFTFYSKYFFNLDSYCSPIKMFSMLTLFYDCIRSGTLLKIAKISVSCIALIFCVYSLFNQNELFMLITQLFVAILLSLVGFQAISSKQKWSGYLLFGSAAFILGVNIVKYTI